MGIIRTWRERALLLSCGYGRFYDDTDDEAPHLTDLEIETDHGKYGNV